MKLPINFPGFAYRNARLAVKRLAETLTICAARSKARMKSGAEPDCLTDFWMQETVKAEKEASARGDPPPPNSSTQEIGNHLLDFLFAAQDASTSSLIWAVALIEAHPSVLARVCDEVSRIWPLETPITSEHLHEMKYTQAVAREVLRLQSLTPQMRRGNLSKN
ncbi:hypothetical protein Droror1_Dr00022808 [Drosera rotundifolia]